LLPILAKSEFYITCWECSNHVKAILTHESFVTITPPT